MTISQQIVDRLTHAGGPHLVLIVTPHVGRLQAGVGDLARRLAWPVLSVAGALAEPLVMVPPRRRPAEAARLLQERLQAMGPGPVLCTDVDLLFEPALRLDPLHMLRACSRQTRLAVAWPGQYHGSILSYARPEHGHYRTWRDPAVDIVPLNG